MAAEEEGRAGGQATCRKAEGDQGPAAALVAGRATSCCDGVQRGKAADTDSAFLLAGKRRKLAAEVVASAASLKALCFMVNKIEASSD